jgi:hypothetical protein
MVVNNGRGIGRDDWLLLRWSWRVWVYVARCRDALRRWNLWIGNGKSESEQIRRQWCWIIS